MINIFTAPVWYVKYFNNYASSSAPDWQPCYEPGRPGEIEFMTLNEANAKMSELIKFDNRSTYGVDFDLDALDNA